MKKLFSKPRAAPVNSKAAIQIYWIINYYWLHCGLSTVNYKTLNKFNASLEQDSVFILSSDKPSFVFFVAFIYTQIAKVQLAREAFETEASIWFEKWGSWVLKVQQTEARSTRLNVYHLQGLFSYMYAQIILFYEKSTPLKSIIFSYSFTIYRIWYYFMQTPRNPPSIPKSWDHDPRSSNPPGLTPMTWNQIAGSMVLT